MSVNLSASAIILYLGPILGIILTFFLYRKMKKKTPDLSFVSMIYPGIVIFTVAFLFMGIVNVMFSYIKDYTTLPTYEATIIDYNSSKKYDDDGGYVMMHNPKVQFKAEGETLELYTNSSSGAEPIIGKTIKIKYAPGRSNVIEAGWKSVLMVVGISSIFFCVLGYSLLYMFFYVLDISRSGLNRAGLFVLTAVIIPGVLLFFIAALGWVLIQYFMGEKEVPLWALAVCSIFVTVLIPSLMGYIKMQFFKEKK